ALACERPADREVPLRRYSLSELTVEVAKLLPIEQLAPSRTAIWRWLAHDALRPWRYRSWIFPRDPHFRTGTSHRPRLLSQAATTSAARCTCRDGSGMWRTSSRFSCNQSPSASQMIRPARYFVSMTTTPAGPTTTWSASPRPGSGRLWITTWSD